MIKLLPVIFSSFGKMMADLRSNQQCSFSPDIIESKFDRQFFEDLYTDPRKVEYLSSLCAVEKTFRVLDVGCGRGELVIKLAGLEVLQAVGVDLASEGIAIAVSEAKKRGLENCFFRQMSALALEFADESFDLVFMTDLVEHLSNSQLMLAIKEIHRVLKKGGKLIIHTQPTVLFKRFGQYLVKPYFEARGISWPLLTIQGEAKIGHINIQSRKSLKVFLYSCFKAADCRLFHSTLNRKSPVRFLMEAFGLLSFLSPHLWAIAEKR